MNSRDFAFFMQYIKDNSPLVGIHYANPSVARELIELYLNSIQQGHEAGSDWDRLTDSQKESVTNYLNGSVGTYNQSVASTRNNNMPTGGSSSSSGGGGGAAPPPPPPPPPPPTSSFPINSGNLNAPSSTAAATAPPTAAAVPPINPSFTDKFDSLLKKSIPLAESGPGRLALGVGANYYGAHVSNALQRILGMGGDPENHDAMDQFFGGVGSMLASGAPKAILNKKFLGAAVALEAMNALKYISGSGGGSTDEILREHLKRASQGVEEEDPYAGQGPSYQGREDPRMAPRQPIGPPQEDNDFILNPQNYRYGMKIK